MSRRLKEENPGQIILMPIAAIITIIPLIVFSKFVKLSEVEMKSWTGEPTYADFFSYYKSQWLIVFTVLALVFFFTYLIIKRFKFEKSFLYIPTALYGGLIVLSTVTSKYSDIAFKGFLGRYEGMLVLLCYLSLMLIVFNLVKAEKQIKFLLGALLISVAIICLIGLFQFLGMDLFKSDFGKKLILPKEYHQFKDNVNFRFEDTYIYSTLTNPNYVGSYAVLLIPVAFIFMLFSKKTYLKIGGAVLTGLLLINLFGSRSRAGLIGLFIIVVISAILFRKVIFKKKILASAIVVGVLVLFFGANFALKGALIERVVSELSLIKSDEAQFFDLQDITFNDNTVSIVSSTETLTIENRENDLFFFDAMGNPVDMKMQQSEGSTAIAFTDPLYKDYNLTVKGNIITVNQKGVSFLLRGIKGGFKLIGINGEETDNIVKAASIGFVGQERLGSARGYIWSRTLPMLKDRLLLGDGPDTFTIEFPQNDYIGKIRAYGTPHMIVDKPHNMYLQIAMNTGVLSLLSVLTLFGFYILQSLKLYMKSMNNSFASISGAGIFLSICGYLAAGVFNDSTVAIAPVFWVLLGLGFVCNKMMSAQVAKAEKVK
ncbi:MAG: O-antigen ligase family protein [Acetivibrionales bacterium]|jgi:O-antigen ligase